MSYRDDTADEKNKFQLYFDDKCVLLINTEKSKKTVSSLITPTDCSLLSHDSYICLDTLFAFDEKYPIIKKEQVSHEAWKRLSKILPCSTLLPQIVINKIQKYIEEILKTPVI